MSEHFASDTTSGLCQLCKEERETEKINVGDDLSSRLMDVCHQCVVEKLLPPDY